MQETGSIQAYLHMLGSLLYDILYCDTPLYSDITFSAQLNSEMYQYLKLWDLYKTFVNARQMLSLMVPEAMCMQSFIKFCYLSKRRKGRYDQTYRDTSAIIIIVLYKTSS